MAKMRGDIRHLIDALSDPDQQVRWSAANVLGKLGAQPAVAALLKLATNAADEGLRAIAVRALGRIGDRSVTSELLELARDDDSFRFRVTVIDTLVHLGDERVIPLLESIVADRNLAERGSISKGEARRTRRWATRRLTDLRAVQALPVLEEAKWGGIRERWQIRRSIKQLQELELTAN
jgi:HEAT repeat protein